MKDFRNTFNSNIISFISHDRRKKIFRPKDKESFFKQLRNFLLYVIVSSKFIDPFNLNLDVVYFISLNKRIGGCNDFALVRINHQNMTNGYGYLVAIGC